MALALSSWGVWPGVPVTPWLWSSLWEGGALIRFLPALGVCDRSLTAPQGAERTEASFIYSAGGLLDTRKANVKCSYGGAVWILISNQPEKQDNRLWAVDSKMPWVVFLLCVCVCVQSCPTLCDPMDYSPPGSSVHGISQARILERVAISFSRGSSESKDRTRISWYHLRWQVDSWPLAPPGRL